MCASVSYREAFPFHSFAQPPSLLRASQEAGHLSCMSPSQWVSAKSRRRAPHTVLGEGSGRWPWHNAAVTGKPCCSLDTQPAPNGLSESRRFCKFERRPWLHLPLLTWPWVGEATLLGEQGHPTGPQPPPGVSHHKHCGYRTCEGGILFENCFPNYLHSLGDPCHWFICQWTNASSLLGFRQAVAGQPLGAAFPVKKKLLTLSL